MGRSTRSSVALGLLLLLSVFGAPALARAHGGNTGPIQVVTQSVGPYELAIMLELPSSAPATVFIDTTPQQPIDGVTLRFRAAPRGQPFEGRPAAEVRGDPGPLKVYYSQLELEQAGDWELEVRAEGPQGSGAARIPFTVTVVPISGSSLGLFAVVGVLALLLITGIVVPAVAGQRGRAAPGWLTKLINQGIFACVVVGAVLGVQQFIETLRTAQPAPAGGRPHANLALATYPAVPLVGQPMTLTLNLSDGGTGLPVDDLVSHHEALLHLVVLDQSGGFMAHLHPARVAPGRFVADLTPDRPGRYSAYAEIARIDSGTQVIAREFLVSGNSTARAPAAQGFGVRTDGPLQIDVRSSADPLRAGSQATLTFRFVQAGQPVLDIQPWLGMAGHLIARSDDGAIFGHIHAAEPATPPGQAGSGVRYGPDIRFASTFPQPGRYQLWAQFKHNDRIVTVPVTVEVVE